jgi:hypothetical protein
MAKDLMQHVITRVPEIAETTQVVAARRRVSRSRKARGSHFSQPPLWWLADHRFNKSIPARSRVLLWLWYATHEGRAEVRFTNEVAEALGISKQHKSDVLNALEAEKMAVLFKENSKTVWVKLCLPGRTANERYTRLEDAEVRWPDASHETMSILP